MAKTVFEIFLSSTSRDLEPHRAKVREMVERLGQAAVCMETWGAQPTAPLDTCRQKILEADALVVLVGHRCGWIPEGNTSITWLEVAWAREAGKPVYAYVIDANAAWLGEKEQDRLVQASSDEEADEVIRAVRVLKDFKAFLLREITCETFTSIDDLGGKVATTLANWIREQRARSGTIAPATPPPLPPWTGSPFPGLRAFTPADAPIFFGRRRETDFLVAKLCDSSCRFLLISGASGSGKSSLVAAGLIPRLGDGAVSRSETWLLPSVEFVGRGRTWIGLRITPAELGDNPFQALAAKLSPMLPGAPSAPSIAQLLESDPRRLTALVESALDGDSPRPEALLFVDQFEELVTSTSSEDRRKRFMDMLAAAAGSSRIRIVATVRADFVHRCIDAEPVLADLLRERGVTVPVAVPGASALRDLIEGPARRAGLRFDEGLVDELVDETVARPGGLALLAFALHELYESRSGDGRLSSETFRKFGGLTGVINERAEATFTMLSKHVKPCLGTVFSRLVNVDENGVATRNRARRDEVVDVSVDAREIVDAFGRARLLVSDRAADGTSVLEVGHEALLREWPRLADWIRERADDLRLLRQVEAAAADWERHKRLPHYGWTHERLVPVDESFERLGINRSDLAEPTRSFVRPESEWLLEELGKPETTHQRRAAIGDRLDQIGDPRPGVGLRPDGVPDIVWCPIPGGSIGLEKLKKRVDVKPFNIAKYAVTYRQYKAFLDDPRGYRSKGHWERLKHEAAPGEQYRPTGNRPAENVSWYEAVAFCRWLSARVGFEVRLPFEAEWQQAATSGDARNAYPWGRSWIDDRANTIESRLGRTIAVGMYDRGASSQDVMDLLGNVYEWCLDRFKRNANGKSASRVLRGGSWDANRRYARAAYRTAVGPGYRGFGVGFRVVCVSPIR